MTLENLTLCTRNYNDYYYDYSLDYYYYYYYYFVIIAVIIKYAAADYRVAKKQSVTDFSTNRTKT